MKELNITADQMLKREKKLRRDIKIRRLRFKLSRYVRITGRTKLRKAAVLSAFIAITYIAAKSAYIQRGYFAIGSEYLIIPMAAFIHIAYKNRRRK